MGKVGIDVAIRQSGTVWTNNGPELDGRNNQTKREKKKKKMDQNKQSLEPRQFWVERERE